MLPLPSRPPFSPHRVGAFLLAVICLACATGPSDAQVVVTERVPTILREGGQVVHLEMVFHKPPGPGPFPTLVFNHGSTGNGTNPALFTRTYSSSRISRVMNALGWMVVFPQRRGRGQSDGVYDEGFEPDRSGYSCNPAYSLPGLERALEDLDAVVAHLRTRPDVAPGPMLVGGASRGGILSVVFAGTRPAVFHGVINFVGGWMSDRCPDPGAINTASFRRGAGYPRPTLWLYGEGDPFYALAHSRANFDAFVAAGGRGTFRSYTVPGGRSGHEVLGAPELWHADLIGYLRSLGDVPLPR